MFCVFSCVLFSCSQKINAPITSKENQHRNIQILKSSLFPKNKTKAINQIAVLLFQYRCAIMNWPKNGDNNQWRSRKNCSVSSQIFSRSSILKYTQTNSLGEVVQVFFVFEGFSSAIWFMHIRKFITMTIHKINLF